ncbi:MAG: aminotransferase class I/II-fold pyridoxal phosphate-dependent enzyme [Bacteroidetes bacterium]|nr:aminotransferase class I/II-fold pyridoxal phosphate-dependent enzyme [Bacteroidota bacterium]
MSETSELRTRKVQVSLMAYNLVASEILTISGQINELKAQGKRIANFTVGDFAKGEFRIPDALTDLIIQQYREGNTNYPPSSGEMPLRQSVADFCRNRLELDYSTNQILIAGGSRPLIYGTYVTIVDPGDLVLYGVPSWNNNHYCHLVNAFPRQIDLKRENNFLPTATEIKEYIGKAVLIALNSPCNPTGTMFTAQQLADICDLVLEENQQRERRGAKPVYLMYDQMYYLMAFNGRQHVHPVGVRPEMKEYTIYIDGISKYLGATGVRVGWAMGPEVVMKRMSGVLGHIGAWSPKPEQLATAAFLQMDSSLDQYLSGLNQKIETRLQRIHHAVQQWKAAGLPVDSIEPQGGLYLSVLFNIKGYNAPDGEILSSADKMRKYLLTEAGVAVVPYEAFGDKENEGWCRISVGGVSDEDITFALESLPTALKKLKWSK